MRWLQQTVNSCSGCGAVCIAEVCGDGVFVIVRTIISPSRISRENNSLEMIRLRRRTAVEIFC